MLTERKRLLALNIEGGYRRVLYDAMVFASSLVKIRECEGYPKPSPDQINAEVEAAHMNALVQLRSMHDFLTRVGKPDDMSVSHFPGCTRQTIPAPGGSGPHARSWHVYAQHKSWDAVEKDASRGAAQYDKRQVVKNGLELLDGFEKFRDELFLFDPTLAMNEYALAYDRHYREAIAKLRSLGV